MAKKKDILHEAILVEYDAPAWEPAFLAELETTGNITASCRAAGISVMDAYRRRRGHADFDARVREILTFWASRNKLRRIDDGTAEGKLVPIPAFDWAANEADFLRVVAETLNPALACRKFGISRHALQAKLDRDLDFRRQYEQAIQEAVDELQGEVYSRAMLASDVLAQFLLRAHRPDVYRNELTLNGKLTLEDAMRRGFERANGS